jgi:hypothetical protein
MNTETKRKGKFDASSLRSPNIKTLRHYEQEDEVKKKRKKKKTKLKHHWTR